MEKLIDSITGETYYGYGNNAFPFKGRCSDNTNHLYVIPARLMGVTEDDIKEFGKETIMKAIDGWREKVGWK